MAERLRFVLDGESVDAPAGVSVAAAVWTLRGPSGLRVSVDGEPRGPLCGMGTCFECLVTIDGRFGVRACMTPLVEGMVVDSGERA